MEKEDYKLSTDLSSYFLRQQAPRQAANFNNHIDAECGADLRAVVRLISAQLLLSKTDGNDGEYVYERFSSKICKQLVRQLLGNFFLVSDSALWVS